jgi:hypothetical protein
MNKTNWTQDIINRFWSKVNYPGNDQDCWEWIAYRGEPPGDREAITRNS